MEWVETTGRTIEEAKELALDQLGVDSGDAEFEVLEEPKVGLFGRTRGNARVKARVSPKSPRPKTERRRRQKRSDGGRGESGRETSDATAGDDASAADPATARKNEAQKKETRDNEAPKSEPRESRSRPARSRDGERSSGPREVMDIEEQKQVLTGFLEELATSFGLTASAEAIADGDELRVNLTGADLGLLVGPRLATLDAIQEVARNTLQRQAEGREYARIVVDVEGIRIRRRDALGEFVAEAAEQVRNDDVTVVFEVMSSADRKVVHDVVTDQDGVVSSSEGEDPRRRVVLRKA